MCCKITEEGTTTISLMAYARELSQEEIPYGIAKHSKF